MTHKLLLHWLKENSLYIVGSASRPLGMFFSDNAGEGSHPALLNIAASFLSAATAESFGISAIFTGVKIVQVFQVSNCLRFRSSLMVVDLHWRVACAPAEQFSGIVRILEGRGGRSADPVQWQFRKYPQRRLARTRTNIGKPRVPSSPLVSSITSPLLSFFLPRSRGLNKMLRY